jgi:hypothetical protein
MERWNLRSRDHANSMPSRLMVASWALDGKRANEFGVRSWTSRTHDSQKNVTIPVAVNADNELLVCHSFRRCSDWLV